MQQCNVEPALLPGAAANISAVAHTLLLLCCTDTGSSPLERHHASSLPASHFLRSLQLLPPEEWDPSLGCMARPGGA